MAVKTMSEPKIERFVHSMQDQGVGVTRTKKGLFLRLPNGDTTTIHFTNSDVRAEANIMARLRRANVRHPDDTKDVKELPKMITEGTTSARARRAVMTAIERLEWPEVVSVSMIRQASGLEHITASKALYHMGFTPVKGKRNGRDWLTPEDILAQKPEPEPEPEVTAESTTFDEPAQDEATAHLFENNRSEPGMAVHLVRTQGDREFIDTHNSWIVDLSRLPVTMTIGDYMQSLSASGVEFEFRCWRSS